MPDADASIGPGPSGSSRAVSFAEESRLNPESLRRDAAAATTPASLAELRDRL
ncbi:MAG: hypothetical protein RL005_1042, partial [Planctomycetota bacterium]